MSIARRVLDRTAGALQDRGVDVFDFLERGGGDEDATRHHGSRFRE